MRFIHLSDLHFGKRVNGFLMIEDQRYILNQILSIIKDENLDAVILAGDIFDKPVSSEESVVLFDEFLVNLSKLNLPVFIVSGNHDSAERLSFGSELFNKNNIYISPVYNGKTESIVLNDSFGEVHFWLLPFIKPIDVKHIYNEQEIHSYDQAVKFAIKQLNVDKTKRNVIVAHQYVTETIDSSVGGLDNIEVSAFDDFDYTALGHIHRAYNLRENIRYCGSPLNYSFNNTGEKAVTIVELKEKDKIEYKYVPIKPLHEMRVIKGTYNELISIDYRLSFDNNDYIHAVLTDKDDVIDAIAKLRTVYPNIMSLEYDNDRTRFNNQIILDENSDEKLPIDNLEELFCLLNNVKMNDEQKEYSIRLIEEIWGEAK